MVCCVTCAKETLPGDLIMFDYQFALSSKIIKNDSEYVRDNYTSRCRRYEEGEPALVTSTVKLNALTHKLADSYVLLITPSAIGWAPTGKLMRETKIA